MTDAKLYTPLNLRRKNGELGSVNKNLVNEHRVEIQFHWVIYWMWRVYGLVVNNEEEVCETNDNENVEEIPIIEITKNEAVKNFNKRVY